MIAKSTALSPEDARRLDDEASAWVAREDAGLSAAEQRALARWLAADPAHRAAHARWRAAWSKLDQPFESGLAQRMAGEFAAESRRRRTRLATAAVAGVAVLVSAAAFWRAGPTGPLPKAAPAIAQAAAVMLTPAQRTLPDGSVAELREGAEIAVNFSAGERVIELLGGEAHFDVKPDAARPFLVRARGVTARAVGTAFSVSMEGDGVAVLVTHGRVAVQATPAGAPAANHDPAPLPAERLVEAGSRVVVDAVAREFVSPVVAVAAPEREDLLAWRAPRVEFTASPLGSAVELLNRHAAARGGPRLVLDDPALADVRISGLFRLDRTEAFVELLGDGFGIAAENRGAEIGLRRAR